MSARIEVVVQDKPDALLVPIAALDVRRRRLAAREGSRNGEIRQVRVEAGLTTLTDVEIVSGLEIGDEVVVGPVGP